jgi:hypothetical protein
MMCVWVRGVLKFWGHVQREVVALDGDPHLLSFEGQLNLNYAKLFSHV